MCGRFVASTPPQQLAKEFALDAVRVDTRPADFNVSPRSTINVVLEEASGDHLERVLEGMRWGLVPSWAKDEKIGDRMINARAETVAEKPAFKRAFTKRRCLVPADAFYEWKVIPGRKHKQPMVIRYKSGEPMAFAGLWERWKSKDADADGPWLRSATVITGAPNDLVAPIHDRMPMILPESAWDRWLDPELDDVAELQRLLVTAPSELFEVYPVSTRVNNVRDHTEACIERVPEEQTLV